MTRIEATMTVGDDGTTATITLPTPIPPGRRRVVVTIHDGRAGGGADWDAADWDAWIARTAGSITDDTFVVPEQLPLDEEGEVFGA